MILQEKIRQKSEGYGKLAPVFLEGAKFALENQWISVEDDLPCNHKELTEGVNTKKVIICTADATVYSNRMNYINGKWQWFGNGKVTHWMPIPELLKRKGD